MKRNRILFSALIVALIVSGMTLKKDANKWSNETRLYDVLSALGEELPAHAVKESNEELVKKGRDLIFEGRTIGPNGKKSKYISKFYVCTSCHSPVREDPDLRSFNPEARLDYVAKNDLRFLQGSPLYGIANRETWYNDDYVLKYGDLVKPANKSLAEATQLCAKVCSSGRHLEDWELEAILAYFWDNQIRLGDLDLSAEEKQKIQLASGKDAEIIELIKSKYAQKSPATFGENPDQSSGYALSGRPSKGKLIFELSCMTCHIEGGVAGMPLEDNKLTFQKFKRNLDNKSDYNIYQISRHGTYAGQGKPRYMPLYPEERMSNQQLEDLRSYILQEAG